MMQLATLVIADCYYHATLHFIAYRIKDLHYLHLQLQSTKIALSWLVDI